MRFVVRVEMFSVDVKYARTVRLNPFSRPWKIKIVKSMLDRDGVVLVMFYLTHFHCAVFDTSMK